MSAVHYRITKCIEVVLDVLVDDEHPEQPDHDYEGPDSTERQEADFWAASIVASVDELGEGHGIVYSLTSRTLPGTLTLEVMNR